jgi:hypothetical protein
MLHKSLSAIGVLLVLATGTAGCGNQSPRPISSTSGVDVDCGLAQHMSKLHHTIEGLLHDLSHGAIDSEVEERKYALLQDALVNVEASATVMAQSISQASELSEVVGDFLDSIHTYSDPIGQLRTSLSRDATFRAQMRTLRMRILEICANSNSVDWSTFEPLAREVSP